ncbi:hypothetical protein BH09BAC4_BH09BAC4_49630 [soil metagenome]
MNRPFPYGRMLYALAIFGIGVEHLLTRTFSISLFPLPAAFPGRLILVISLGIVLTLAGLSMLTGRKAASSAWLLGLLWLLVAFTLHVPDLVRTPQNGSKWTVIFELVALGGGAFYLAGELTLPDNTTSRMGIGRVLFAVSLVVFGVLHFWYAAFIATLIPAWIPGRLFWAYIVGIGFLATALSLVIQKQVSLATNLLGWMFLLWVVILHAPRVVANPQIEPEWTSLFIALAMSGISFAIARSVSQKALPSIKTTLSKQ